MTTARHAKHYLEAVMANVIDGIITIDDRGVIRSFNPAAEAIFGYEAAEVVGQNVKLLTPKPFRSESDRRVAAYVRTGLAGVVGSNREAAGCRKDGSVFPMDLAVSEAVQDGRRVFIGAIRDITERKQNEEALRKSEERFELAVQGSKDGLWDWDIVSDEVYYAPQYRTLLGYEEDEFPGVADSFRNHLHPDDRERVFSGFMNHLKNRVPFDEEFRHRCKDGSMRYLRARGQAIWDENAIATRMAGSISDITEHKEVENRLARQALEARLLHQATAMAAETDSFGDSLQSCVDIVCEMTGWPVGHVYLPDDGGREQLVPSGIWRRNLSPAYDRFREVTERTPFSRGVGLPGRIWASGEPAWIENVQKDDNFPRAKMCEDIGVKGAFGFPVTIRGEIVAVLEFFNDGAVEPDEHLLMRMRTVGEQVGRVLERKRAVAKVRKARDAAETANRAKSQFLANMSHELRTPLNSVIGFSNVLLKDDATNLTGEQLAYLERIRDNGVHLLFLINEVLDISKIEAGHVELEIGPLALDEIARVAISTVEGSALEKKLELVADLPQGLDPVPGDATRLRQVLINLLGNAVKFTEKGKISVRLVPADGTRRPERIEVEDTGIGIQPGMTEGVFEAFQQADSSTTRKYGGTGLGLAISRSLCRLMGFDLVVRSRVGHGSTFSILLGQEPKRGVE